MPYGFVQDVPADERMYREIRARLGEEPPPGLIAHLVLTREGGGLRYVDVWEREEDWEQFRSAQVEPAVEAVLAGHGLPHDHSLVTTSVVEVVDAWIGGARQPT